MSSVPAGSETLYVGDAVVVTSLNATSYSVQIIGKNAILWANRLQAQFRLPSVRNELRQMGAGFLNLSNIRDLSLPMDAGYEERAQFDLTLSISTVISEKASFVKTAEFELNVER